MDNSSIHRKNVIRELVEPGGHQLLFLPKYSPALKIGLIYQYFIEQYLPYKLIAYS